MIAGYSISKRITPFVTKVNDYDLVIPKKTEVQKAPTGSKMECFVKYNEKNEKLLLEKAKADEIANDLNASTSDRAAAIAVSIRLHNEIFNSLPYTLQTIIDQPENGNNFSCPIK